MKSCFSALPDALLVKTMTFLPRVVVKEADIGDADDDVDNRRDCENDYGDYK